MTTIEFTIKGLAAFYRKDGDDSWTVVFPTNNKHQATLTYNKVTGETGSEELKDRTVEILPTETAAPANYQDDLFEKHLIDLTSDYLHSEGVRKRAVFLNDTRTTHLRIPHASLTSKELRENRLNFVFSFDEPDKIRLIKDKDNPALPQIFSKYIGGTIGFKDENGKIKFNIDGKSIELSPGDSFEINNDCDSESQRNDFQLYQDVFENKADANKFFEMISIINPKPAEKQEGEEDFDSPVKIETEPPPLICDGVRISLTDGLD